MRKTVCLSMIVKNETSVIKRCLDSLKDYIDYWIICDTGSTDGTQELIKEILKGIPGELHEHKWENFSHNRNLALTISKEKADYSLIIDADDILIINNKNYRDNLTDRNYLIGVKHGNIYHKRVHLVRNDTISNWQGPVHEVLCPDSVAVFTPDIHIQIVGGGDRSSNPLQKFLNDAKLLENELKKDPTNTRYKFYLAQSYKDAWGEALIEVDRENATWLKVYENNPNKPAKSYKEQWLENKENLSLLTKAIETYKERIDMPINDQERYISCLRLGSLLQSLASLQTDENERKSVLDQAVNYYIKSQIFDKNRAEGLTLAAELLRHMTKFQEAYELGKVASELNPPENALFLEQYIYDYKALDEFAISAYWCGKYKDSFNATLKLMNINKYPTFQTQRIKDNLKFALQKLKEQNAELYKNIRVSVAIINDDIKKTNEIIDLLEAGTFISIDTYSNVNSIDVNPLATHYAIINSISYDKPFESIIDAIHQFDDEIISFGKEDFEPSLTKARKPTGSQTIIIPISKLLLIQEFCKKCIKNNNLEENIGYFNLINNQTVYHLNLKKNKEESVVSLVNETDDNHMFIKLNNVATTFLKKHFSFKLKIFKHFV